MGKSEGKNYQFDRITPVGSRSRVSNDLKRRRWKDIPTCPRRRNTVRKSERREPRSPCIVPYSDESITGIARIAHPTDACIDTVVLHVRTAQTTSTPVTVPRFPCVGAARPRVADDMYHDAPRPAASAMRLRKLSGLISVQTSSMYCRHSAFGPRLPTARHPAGTLLSSRQMEYCSS